MKNDFKKRDYKQQNNWGYQKDSNNRYKTYSNRYNNNTNNNNNDNNNRFVKND